MMKMKKSKSPFTTDFWGDLLDSGYIKPDELCADKKDAKRVNDAIAVLTEYRDSYEAAYPDGIG